MKRVHVGILALLFSSFASSLGALGCGGGGDQAGAQTASAQPSYDDALALLPANAIAIGTVDGRAFYGSQTFGADLAKLTEKYVPIGQEAGFQASRDVDRVTWGTYSYQGLDVAAIVVGRFDEAKIKQAAAAHTATKSGQPLVVSQYLGRDVYTVSNVGFTLLSADHAVAGTESGIRRVLERIHDNRVKRDLPSWMTQTIETQGAAAAVAADFATQPIPAELARQIPLPFLQGMKAVRAVATFTSGVQIAGSMTYPDEASAQSASQQVQGLALWKVVAIVGVKLQSVNADKSDVQVKVAIDDWSLRSLLATVPQLLGQ